MAATYDEKRRELLSIDEEKVTLEKMKKQVLEQEEEMALETSRSIQQLSDSSDRWREDASLQKIFYEQQTILAEMQKKRVEFTEDFEKYMRTYSSQLNQREEDCLNDLRKLEEDNLKKEEKRNGNDY